MGKVQRIFAELATPNCGLFIVNENNFMYDFSWKKNAIIGTIKTNLWEKEFEEKLQLHL